ALQPLLRPNYNARIEERLYVTPSQRSIYADVSVHRLQTREAPVAYATAEASPSERDDQSLARPWIVSLDDEPPAQTYIEIIRVDSREVVTVIEVLSPANKALGGEAEEYARKRRELLGSQANLVEIDLLSQGVRPFPQPAECDAARCRYMVGVSRATDRSRYELYPIALADVLPRFRVPLRPPDPDVPLDLQAVFSRCYDEGAYGDLLDYTQPPATVLTESERSFVAQRLQALHPTN
ncbi:MAG: DUF4058 family protein, partial [Anaerolineae bacterium]|nr:DUF4058 family protein [Candidatus Roseilinea sp.]MDW8448592.1 DUF4058 family protein [Anaerolineae bacterium]